MGRPRPEPGTRLWLTKKEWSVVWLGVTVLLFLVFTFVVFRLSYGSDIDLGTIHRERKRRKLKDKRKTSYDSQGRAVVTFKEFVETAQSGDILAVSYNSKSGRLVKVFIGSIWTHCGLVLLKENKEGESEPFVLEIAHYRNEGLYGAVLKPLEEWVEHNMKRHMAVRRYTGRDFPTEEILSRAKRDQIRGVKPDFNPGHWMKTMVKRDYGDEDYAKHEKYYCSEYITHLMQEFGVIEQDYYPDGYQPRDLLYGAIPLLASHAYDPPAILARDMEHAETGY